MMYNYVFIQHFLSSHFNIFNWHTSYSLSICSVACSEICAHAKELASNNVSSSRPFRNETLTCEDCRYCNWEQLYNTTLPGAAPPISEPGNEGKQ